MRVTFHGVRGSTPCQSDDIRRYGGNTSCVSVDAPGQDPLLLDMGTGLRYFGKRVPTDTLFRGNCLLTHLHWDHVQGLPFFTPLLREGSSLDVYGPSQDDGRTLEEVVSHDHSSSAVSCQRRRAARHCHVPRHRRHRVHDRLVQHHVAPRSAPRPDPRLSRRVRRPFDRLPLGSSAAVRRQLLGVARCSRAGRRVSTC